MCVSGSPLEAVGSRSKLQNKIASEERLDAKLLVFFLHVIKLYIWLFWIKFTCINDYMLILANLHLQVIAITCRELCQIAQLFGAIAVAARIVVQSDIASVLVPKSLSP